MQSCLICYEEEIVIQCKNCKFQYCLNCLLKWLKTQTESKGLIDQLKCPVQHCEFQYHIDTIINIFKEHNFKQEEIQSILFNAYLKFAKDVRPCPKQNCKNYGILPKNKCSRNLECNLCGSKWTDDSLIPFYLKNATQIKQIKDEIFSNIFEFIFTKECPNCNRKIQKNGGCSHMRCQKCNHYFCWICKLKVDGHKPLFCLRFLGIYAVFVLYLILNLLVLLNLFEIIIISILGTIFSILIYELLLIASIAQVFFASLIIKEFSKQFKKQQRQTQNLGNYVEFIQKPRIICNKEKLLKLFFATLIQQLSIQYTFTYKQIALEDYAIGVAVQIGIFVTVMAFQFLRYIFNHYFNQRWMKFVY